jgi:hypothetical protein
MACDTIPNRRRRNQTLAQRKQEVRGVVDLVQSKLSTRTVQARVDKVTGAIAFDGLTAEERADVSDACIYRLIMATGSALARQQIARAEQLAGRGVSRQALAQGIHSHDGGRTFDGGH